MAGLRHLAKRLETAQVSGGGGWPWPTVGVNPVNAITCIWLLLGNCPDEGAISSTAGLEFIEDEHFRQSIRLDASSSQIALDNGEWKAATVLAGSAIEALLLYAISKRSPDERARAIANITPAIRIDPSKPDNWTLAPYIEVALELTAINPDTATQVRLVKDFRNLIHPGREIRKQQKCDRATALSPAAELHHVIRDLSQWL